MAYRIGTSGWQYKHWRGVFYPEGLAQKGWLVYYASHFDTVEINASFYREPTAKSWQRWRDGVPAGFDFAVKANRYVSHFKRFKDAESSVRRVTQGAEKLQSRLGPILYQARPDFARTGQNVTRLEQFLDLLPADRRHVLEFRHDSWYGVETQEQLGRHGVAFCCHDMHGLATPLVATAGFAYVRFHGRDARYAGSYSDESLHDWADRLSQLASGVDDVWAYFNNDEHGFAVQNAATLRRLLQER